MKLFKGQSLLEFTERFKTDLDCEEYLASIKWEKGYCCRKCGHKKLLLSGKNQESIRSAAQVLKKQG